MRPIHRWPSFWLGVLVLIFLSWAWIRSITRDDLVRYRPGSDHSSFASPTTEPWYILRSAGGFAWWETRRDSFGTATAPRFEHHSETSARTVSFPAPYKRYSVTFLARGGGSPSSFSSTAIAYWLIILLFTIAWTALLTWRWRRMKRLIAESADPTHSHQQKNSAT